MATYNFKTPVSEEDIKKLRIGDTIFLTGKVYTARDEAHELLLELKKSGKEIPFNPKEMALFHCGPVMKKEGDKWIVVAGGPTTSARMEIFEYEFIREFRTPIIIGKGEMGDRTAKAMKEFNAVYTAFTGGCGSLAAKNIKDVETVYWLEELGIPEAVWIFDVENFGPLTVTIDSTGDNWDTKVKKEIEKNRPKVNEILGIN